MSSLSLPVKRGAPRLQAHCGTQREGRLHQRRWRHLRPTPRNRSL